MRRAIRLALTMLLCLTLCSCAAREARVDYASEIRAGLLASERICFTARLRCDMGDRVWDCRLGFEGGENGAVITVIEPEIISGLQIGVDGELSSLVYDGAVLDVGEVFSDGGSAVEALPFIIRALREDYVAEAYSERLDGTACTVLVMDAGGDAAVAVWFADERTPLRAEIRRDGKTVVFCTFFDFTY